MRGAELLGPGSIEPMDGSGHRDSCHDRLWSQGLVLLLLFIISAPVISESLTGAAIMHKVREHNPIHPYVFERQLFILHDQRGHRDVRQARRYSRKETDGTLKFLLVFDDPPEVSGVAMLATRSPQGAVSGGIYLPALGAQLTESMGEGGRFLGTDFNLHDLSPERLSDFHYRRKDDQTWQETPYFVVEAIPVNAQVATRLGYSRLQHFIRQGSFAIERTDYFDRLGRALKRMTRHDMAAEPDGASRPRMLLMDQLRDQHQSLIKISERVYSHEYVPRELFEPRTLFANRHRLEAGVGIQGLTVTESP